MWRISRPDAIAVLEDERARKSLRRYFSMLQDDKPAEFMLAKKLPAEFRETDSLESLWEKHADLADVFRSFEREVDEGRNFEKLPLPKQSYLDMKIEIAGRIVQSCHFCTRRCGVNRLTTGLGYCGCGKTMAVSSIFPHLGEEPELVPSGTIFTMGCTMRCLHCQNWTISQWKEDGTEYTPEELAKEIEELRRGGCRNANLVGGEPTPWLWRWLQTCLVGVNVPVVWNSNSYYSEETARLLAGFADVYLLDFKYGPGDCAERISDAPDYWAVCTRNHLDAKRNGELIIRVLVLPGHLKCCTKPILNWIVENLGIETRVNLMFQYRPEWRANEIPELRRRLSKTEIHEVVRLAENAGLVNFIT